MSHTLASYIGYRYNGATMVKGVGQSDANIGCVTLQKVLFH